MAGTAMMAELQSIASASVKSDVKAELIHILHADQLARLRNFLKLLPEPVMGTPGFLDVARRAAQGDEALFSWMGFINDTIVTLEKRYNTLADNKDSADEECMQLTEQLRVVELRASAAEKAAAATSAAAATTLQAAELRAEAAERSLATTSAAASTSMRAAELRAEAAERAAAAASAAAAAATSAPTSTPAVATPATTATTAPVTYHQPRGLPHPKPFSGDEKDTTLRTRQFTAWQTGILSRWVTHSGDFPSWNRIRPANSTGSGASPGARTGTSGCALRSPRSA